MKLSKVAEKLQNHENHASCTLTQLSDNSWEAVYIYFNGVTNCRRTKKYKNIEIDIHLNMQENFSIFYRNYDTNSGTYYLNKFPEKYINLYFYS